MFDIFLIATYLTTISVIPTTGTASLRGSFKENYLEQDITVSSRS